MRDKLTALFPEVNLIKDTELKQKVLEVWEDAVRLGGWELEDLQQIPFTLLIPNVGVNLVDHTRAVTLVALESAKVMAEFYSGHYEINMDYLVAGGLLHDVGKLLEFGKGEKGFEKSPSGRLLRHPFSGAGLAVKHGLPDTVVHIIATHAKEGEGGYRCPEAVIVHHADFMNFEPLRK